MGEGRFENEHLALSPVETDVYVSVELEATDGALMLNYKQKHLFCMLQATTKCVTQFSNFTAY